MAIAGFDELCAGLCELAAVPRPVLQADADGRVAFHVVLRGTTVNLIHCPDESPGHFFVLFELGPLPPAEDGTDPTAGLRALLQANHALLQVHPPVFSLDPATGQVVLQHVCPLFDTTPVEVFELMSQGIETASRWREGLSMTGRNVEPAPANGASVLAMPDFA
jgi:hypothetical protein